MPTFDEIEGWLLDATAAVPRSFFEMPVAGREDPIFRERVYCYQLYHQWLVRWRKDDGLDVGCEIDKSGHPIIVDCEDKPDFLVHEPGSMEHNLLILEVKTASTSSRKIAEDWIKLCRFRGAPASYQHAIFLIFGMSLDDWMAKRDRVMRAIRPGELVALDLFGVLLHETPESRARYVP